MLQACNVRSFVLCADTLSGFFILITLIAALSALLYNHHHIVRIVLITSTFLIAYLSPSLFLVASAYVVTSLLQFKSIPLVHQRGFFPYFLTFVPSIALWVGCGILWLSTATWRYDLPIVPFGFSSMIFWWVLIATIGGSFTCPTLFSIAWFYPLLRFSTITAWNQGWHEATMVSGGAIALWSSWQTFAAQNNKTSYTACVRMYLGIALLMLGMGGELGYSASCYALLAALLQEIGYAHGKGWSLLLLSSVLPCTTPFVVVWIGMGAAGEHGSFSTICVLWLTVLFSTLALFRQAQYQKRGQQPSFSQKVGHIVATTGSIILGTATPWIMPRIILPVVQRFEIGRKTTQQLLLLPWDRLTTSQSMPQEGSIALSFIIVVLIILSGVIAWFLAPLMPYQQNDRSHDHSFLN